MSHFRDPKAYTERLRKAADLAARVLAAYGAGSNGAALVKFFEEAGPAIVGQTMARDAFYAEFNGFRATSTSGRAMAVMNWVRQVERKFVDRKPTGEVAR